MPARAEAEDGSAHRAQVRLLLDRRIADLERLLAVEPSAVDAGPLKLRLCQYHARRADDARLTLAGAEVGEVVGIDAAALQAEVQADRAAALGLLGQLIDGPEPLEPGPRRDAALRLAATLRLASGDVAGGRLRLEQILTEHPAPDDPLAGWAARRAGELLLEGGDVGTCPEIERRCGAGARANPSDLRALRCLAAGRACLGKHREAAEAWHQMLAAAHRVGSPITRDASRGLASSLEALRRKDRDRFLARVLAPELGGYVYLPLGRRLAAAGQHAEAFELFKRATAQGLTPGDRQHAAWLGVDTAIRGHLGDALASDALTRAGRLCTEPSAVEVPPEAQSRAEQLVHGAQASRTAGKPWSRAIEDQLFVTCLQCFPEGPLAEQVRYRQA
ncbi:MAG: hypothetical protein KC620_16495, partial [Myxococcales bacterium]|nr:hypothetical protein [Myxococcales bacterium]